MSLQLPPPEQSVPLQHPGRHITPLPPTPFPTRNQPRRADGRELPATNDGPDGGSAISGGAPSIDVVLTLASRPAIAAHADLIVQSALPDAADGVSGTPGNPVVHVRISESIVRYFHGKDARVCDASPAAADRAHSPSSVLERLSQALGPAGIELGAIDGTVENAMRLAVVASLFDFRIPTPAAPRQKRFGSALPKWRLMRVLEFIDANLSEPIALADLAAAAGMSRMYFASQFRTATGIRPHEFVLRKRIERAQRLLLTTSEALVEIALSVGFQTQAHFTTVFKKIVGSTPYQWRRDQRHAC